MLHYDPQHVSSSTPYSMQVQGGTLNLHTVWLFTEGDDTRGCGDTICPPGDGQHAARNMLRIVVQYTYCRRIKELCIKLVILKSLYQLSCCAGHIHQTRCSLHFARFWSSSSKNNNGKNISRDILSSWHPVPSAPRAEHWNAGCSKVAVPCHHMATWHTTAHCTVPVLLSVQR